MRNLAYLKTGGAFFVASNMFSAGSSSLGGFFIISLQKLIRPVNKLFKQNYEVMSYDCTAKGDETASRFMVIQFSRISDKTVFYFKLVSQIIGRVTDLLITSRIF